MIVQDALSHYTDMTNITISSENLFHNACCFIISNKAVHTCVNALFLWMLLDSLAKDFDLLLDFHPKLKMLQVNIVTAGRIDHANPLIGD